MIPVIEAVRATGYPTHMRSVALGLLALVAVLLMPFGMSAAPAATVHHQQMAMVANQHCPDQGSGSHSNALLSDCTMACAAALPASDLQAIERVPLIPLPVEPAAVAKMSGIELEIATPPPRLS